MDLLYGPWYLREFIHFPVIICQHLGSMIMRDVLDKSIDFMIERVNTAMRVGIGGGSIGAWKRPEVVIKGSIFFVNENNMLDRCAIF